MKLLLAEDERELSKALVTMLKLNNYTVDAVYNGIDAIDYVSCNDYDGIILDIMMPGLDGLSVLKKLREKGVSTPIMMLTAKSEIDDKCKGLDLGADDYLTKPFSSKELISRINALVRRKGSIIDDTISYEDIVLNRKTFELSKDGNTIKLNNKEYQLLELFMLSPKIVFSTDTLLDKVWSTDTFTELNTVWVYLSNIRKKLKELDSKVEIYSSRNQGYYIGVRND